MAKTLGIAPAAAEASAGPSIEDLAGADEGPYLPPPVDEGPGESAAGKLVSKLPEGTLGKVVSGFYETAAFVTHDDVFKPSPSVQDAWDQLLNLVLAEYVKNVKAVVIVALLAFILQDLGGKIVVHLQHVEQLKKLEKAKQAVPA